MADSALGAVVVTQLRVCNQWKPLAECDNICGEIHKTRPVPSVESIAQCCIIVSEHCQCNEGAENCLFEGHTAGRSVRLPLGGSGS